jgi:hypothetical protein
MTTGKCATGVLFQLFQKFAATLLGGGKQGKCNHPISFETFEEFWLQLSTSL